MYFQLGIQHQEGVLRFDKKYPVDNYLRQEEDVEQAIALLNESYQIAMKQKSASKPVVE